MKKDSDYFSGRLLLGDDFTESEIAEWFSDEAEAYANLGAKDRENYSYGYHRLNEFHAFRFLKGVFFEKALGVGSAYGDEFLPIANSIGNITILDPSDSFNKEVSVLGVSCDYKKPSISGEMPFEDCEFDLISCLGVMHHIPNVSYVMRECYRCLRKDGLMIIREPITSMGDWNFPRKGLTKRERGIPLDIFEGIIKSAGFSIVSRAPCNFPMLPKIAQKLGFAAYNNYIFTLLDKYLSFMFFWNDIG